MGTVIQSQSRSNDAAWGTMAENGKNVYEASDLPVRILCDGNEFTPFEGKNETDAANPVIEYSLGKEGVKTLQFKDKSIVVTVRHKNRFSETIPVLKQEEALLSYAKQGIGLASGSHSVNISLQKALDIESSNPETDLKYKECSAIKITGKDQLSYEINL